MNNKIINTEAERGILGSILVGDMAARVGEIKPIDRCIDAGVTGEWFSLATHRATWTAMTNLHTNGKPIDTITIGKETGSYDILYDLMDNTPTASNLPAYLDIAEGVYKRRRVQGLAQEAQDAVMAEDADVPSIIARLGDGFDAITSNRDRTTMRQHMMNNIKVLWNAMNGETSGLPLPWPKFSERTGGVQTQAVTPLVGRDGKGKSGASAQIADFWAGQDIPVLFISLEDDPRRTLLRMAGCRKWFSAREWEQASVYFEGKQTKFNKGQAQSLERKLLEYTDWLDTKRVEVIDGDFTGEDVRTEMKAFRRRHGIKDDEKIGVFVDGFKDLTFSLGDNTTSKESHTSKQLQKGAKESNAALIPVSHILKIPDDVPICKEHIKGSGTQFQGARGCLIFQDAGVTGSEGEDDFVLSSTKANYARGGSTRLKRDVDVLKYQEV